MDVDTSYSTSGAYRCLGVSSADGRVEDDRLTSDVMILDDQEPNRLTVQLPLSPETKHTLTTSIQIR